MELNAELVHAAREGDINEVKRLLALGADIDNLETRKSSPLNSAVMGQHLDVIRFLLMKGANPNLLDIHGLTPLHRAVSYKRLNIVREFLAHKADPNIKAWDDATVFDILFQGKLFYENTENIYAIAEALLDHGADPNVKSEVGQTALSRIAVKGYTDVAELFLSHGADPNIVDNYGESILSVACNFNKLEIVKLLLFYGADPNIRSSLTKSALYVALKRDYADIAQELLANGARLNDNDYDLIEFERSNTFDIILYYFPTLQNLSMRSIRGNHINITTVPENLYSAE